MSKEKRKVALKQDPTIIEAIEKERKKLEAALEKAAENIRGVDADEVTDDELLEFFMAHVALYRMPLPIKEDKK